MTLDSLHDLYVDHIQDLYSAETHIIGALPKRIESASHTKLRDGFTTHLEEGSDILKAKGDDDVVDAALISAAQRVEHYEMAGLWLRARLR